MEKIGKEKFGLLQYLENKTQNINISHRHMLHVNCKSRTLARLLIGVLLSTELDHVGFNHRPIHNKLDG